MATKKAAKKTTPRKQIKHAKLAGEALGKVRSHRKLAKAFGGADVKKGSTFLREAGRGERAANVLFKRELKKKFTKKKGKK